MSRVVDSESGQELGRYTTYYREPYWFFVGLDRPNMGCDGPDGGPNTKHPNSFLIYRDVLIPMVGKNKYLKGIMLDIFVMNDSKKVGPVALTLIL